MALDALKIQTADLVGKLVAQLSNRPTNPLSSGGDNLTAQEVKERYDAYGHLLKERFNALVDALVADPSTDTDALANNIKVYLGDPAEDDPLSLADALVALVTEIAKKYEKPEGGIPATDLAEAVTDAINGKYVKPGTGIPETDLETAVQTSLGKADTAYQKPSGGIPATDLAEAIRTILTNAVSQSEFAPVKALAESADIARAFEDYSALVYNLVNVNAVSLPAFKVGQKIFVKTSDVPDVWIYAINSTPVMYTYTTDAAFEAALVAGTLQVGYFTLAPVEGKTDLSDYATTAALAAVSDSIDALIDALVDGVMAVAEANYAESATYAQQADIANQINTDREIEDADTACPPVVFGTVGGNAEVQNGKMKFTELRGNTIKWNQLVQNGNFESTTNWNNIDSTFTVSNNVGSLLASVQAGRIYNVSTSRPTIYANHKYLVSCSIRTTTATDQIQLLFHNGNAAVNVTASVATTNEQILAGIVTVSTTLENGGQIVIRDYRVSDWDTVYIKNIQLFDLTYIYGAGKEPSTVAEFVRDFPMPYYPHNAGTLLSSKSSSVDFTKRNQWDKSTEPITNDRRVSVSNGGSYPSSGYSFSSLSVLPGETYCIVAPTSYDHYYACFDANGDYISGGGWTTTLQVPINCTTLKFDYKTSEVDNICIYVNWNTPGLPYVPYAKQHIVLPNLELRSAGSVYDVLYQQGGGKRRIGVVDLGTLNWTWQSTYNCWRCTDLVGIIKDISSDNTVGNIRCSKFAATYRNAIEQGLVTEAIAEQSGGVVSIISASLPSTASMPSALSGVMLYYELATETDITVEENPGWDEYAEIDNFGTVKFNQDPAQDIPVPQAYFVRYTVNLVEFLDSLYVHCGGDVSKILLDS